MTATVAAHWVAAEPTTRVIDYWDPHTGIRRTNRTRVTRTAHLTRDDRRTVCGRRLAETGTGTAIVGAATTGDEHGVDYCWHCTDIGPEAHTHRDMRDAAGITYRQLDHWNRQGWLVQDPGPSGSGTRRTWSPVELAVATRMGELTRAGVVASVAARQARDEIELAAPRDLELAWASGRGELA